MFDIRYLSLLLFLVIIFTIGESFAQSGDSKPSLFNLSIFHRRDASKLMEWDVNDQDTLFYMSYYPKDSEYFRYLVYRLNLPSTDRLDLRFVTFNEADTLDVTQMKNFRSNTSEVLQKDIRGATRQHITIIKSGDYFASFWLMFQREKQE